MTVDKSTVEQIARLARLKIADDKKEALAEELNQILGWVEQLSELDTEGVEPMTSVVEVDLPLRADEVTDGAIAEKVTANAPESTHNFYVVPKVVE